MIERAQFQVRKGSYRYAGREDSRGIEENGMQKANAYGRNDEPAEISGEEGAAQQLEQFWLVAYHLWTEGHTACWAMQLTRGHSRGTGGVRYARNGF